MATTQIKDSLAGEDLLAIEPELLQLERMPKLAAAFIVSSRAGLSAATALTNEQTYRRPDD